MITPVIALALLPHAPYGQLTGSMGPDGNIQIDEGSEMPKFTQIGPTKYYETRGLPSKDDMSDPKYEAAKAAEAPVMQALRNALRVPGEQPDHCDWKWVTCWYGVVTEITVTEVGIVGQLPDVFTTPDAFPLLLQIDFDSNSLRGPIPPMNLPFLRFLYLGRNKFSGQLPSFDGLPLLEYLTLHENQLTGTLPSMEGMPKIGQVFLQDNQIEGPLVIDKLGKLENILAQNNKFSGPVPTLPEEMVTAQLGGNHFSSASGQDLSMLKNLEVLSLEGNEDTFEMPAPWETEKLAPNLREYSVAKTQAQKNEHWRRKQLAPLYKLQHRCLGIVNFVLYWGNPANHIDSTGAMVLKWWTYPFFMCIFALIYLVLKSLLCCVCGKKKQPKQVQKSKKNN